MVNGPKGENFLVFHGGGLVDCSKQAILRLAEHLIQIYEKVFIGYYSFEALYTREFWVEYNRRLETTLANARGTCFGTCRDIFIKGEKLQKAIELLKQEGITTIIVLGGDGSSRQISEMYEAFKAAGINIIFAIPLTIDGINGGDSIGLEQAKRESVRQIENMAATSLETRDNEQFGVLCAEIQGRNRDDITAKVLQHFVETGKVADRNLEDLDLYVVPANLATEPEKLYDAINASTKRTAVFFSEGAKTKIADLKANTSRKVRTVIVGHQSQSNNQTNGNDLYLICEWVQNAFNLIKDNQFTSFCIRRATSNGVVKYERKDIHYYARLNPYKGQVAEISEELENLLKAYMAN